MALPNLPPWIQPTNSTLVRFLLLFASGWALVTLIQYFYGIIAIFTAASLIAVLLNYPVQRFSRYMPRGLAIGLVFLGSMALLLGVATLLGWEIAVQGQGLLNRVTESLQSSSFLPIRRLLNNLELDRLLATFQTSLISGLGVLQTLFSIVPLPSSLQQ
jgi:predicted PurR-regulated permease PerM